jgi:hypothetical protein
MWGFVATSAAIYAGFWLLGWIIAGFMGDEG